MSIKLPEYIVMKDMQSDCPSVLCQEAQEVAFPLSLENQKIIETLEAKYDAEENCAGLAAPQIGYDRKIIIFAVQADEALKKWRSDLSETMPKTIWLNPSYEPIGDEMTIDVEACFSVPGVAGPVARYTHIRYWAFLPDGTKVEGEASGFLARVIQHEVDHINGKLYVELVPEGELLSIEEYRRRRAEAMEQETLAAEN